MCSNIHFFYTIHESKIVSVSFTFSHLSLLALKMNIESQAHHISIWPLDYHNCFVFFAFSFYIIIEKVKWSKMMLPSRIVNFHIMANYHDKLLMHFVYNMTIFQLYYDKSLKHSSMYTRYIFRLFMCHLTL